MPLSKTAPEALFTLDMTMVKNALSNTNSRYNFTQLDNADNLTKFRKMLNLELAEMVFDAVEIAFCRTFESALNKESHVEPSSDDDDDDTHSYEYKDHCLNCSAYWKNNHNLEECIQEDHVSECFIHSNHNGAVCNWNNDCSEHGHEDGDGCGWQCSEHKDHELSECEDSCTTVHSHDAWDSAVANGDMPRSDHDNLFDECNALTDDDELILIPEDSALVPF